LTLGEAGPLLRFAAERVKELDPNSSLAVAEARAPNDKWTPQLSQTFWAAFSKLCDVIQPVTLECLAAGHPSIDRCTFRLTSCEPTKISIAERSSKRYFAVLIGLLAVILPIQLYVWTCTNLSKKIDDLRAA
jgi:hypothetical protein